MSARLGAAAALVPFALFVWYGAYLPGIGSDFEVTQTIAWVPALNVDLAFRLDGFSLLFTLLVTVSVRSSFSMPTPISPMRRPRAAPASSR